MIRFLCALSLLFFPTISPADEMPTPAKPEISTSAPGHGGGCRKDSPPGKCCHAGSKPYHCH
ncbi:MAG: hypothetical protein CMF72_13135 [Mameliella sp.]|nr:hypothetical protein [Mameliella sp.]